MKKRKKKQSHDPRDNVIHYLNTDLCLESKADVSKLVDYFDAKDLQPIVGAKKNSDGLWCVNFAVILPGEEPEQSIDQMLKVIESLPRALRKTWLNCSLREFNIGYDCGDEPWAFNQGMSEKLVKRIAAASASVRITLYPYREPKPGPASCK